jgi:hypothetical protein
VALDRFNQPPIIAVAGEEHHLVDLLRQLHGVDGQFNFHFAFGTATAIAIEEFLRCLGDDGVSVLIQPIDQWLDDGVHLALDEAGVIKRAQKFAAAFELIPQAPIVDIKTERPCGRMQIRPVDEECYPVGARRHAKKLL